MKQYFLLAALSFFIGLIFLFSAQTVKADWDFNPCDIIWCEDITPTVEVTPTLEVTPEVTESPTASPSAEVTPTPTTPPAGHGDGRSDGKSSCPSCTQAPKAPPATGRAL